MFITAISGETLLKNSLIRIFPWSLSKFRAPSGAEGYTIGTNGAQKIEMNDHTKYGTPDIPCFAYMQAENK